MALAVARTYLTFGDLEGKLDVLRVECSRCQRKGRYSVAKLIEKYGRRGNMMKWEEQLNGDCPDCALLRRVIAHLVEGFSERLDRSCTRQAVPRIDRLVEIFGGIVRQPHLALIVLPDQSLRWHVDRE